jgi:hypothetical protein
MLYPNEANKLGCGRLYIFGSAEATTNQFENRSNQGRMAKVLQQFDRMLQQVNPFAEL